MIIKIDDNGVTLSITQEEIKTGINLTWGQIAELMDLIKRKFKKRRKK